MGRTEARQRANNRPAPGSPALCLHARFEHFHGVESVHHTVQEAGGEPRHGGTPASHNRAQIVQVGLKALRNMPTQAPPAAASPLLPCLTAHNNLWRAVDRKTARPQSRSRPRIRNAPVWPAHLGEETGARRSRAPGPQRKRGPVLQRRAARGAGVPALGGRPAPSRTIHSTRSTPATSSVTPCSTCRRRVDLEKIEGRAVHIVEELDCPTDL